MSSIVQKLMQLKCEYTSFWLNLDSNTPLYCSNLDSRIFEAWANTRETNFKIWISKGHCSHGWKFQLSEFVFENVLIMLGSREREWKVYFQQINEQHTYVYDYESNCLPAEKYVLTILVINKSSFGYLYLICACAIRNSFPLC